MRHAAPARVLLSPSILTADFGAMGEQVRAVEPLVDWFHLDVMDGHYVPNITFGPSTVEAIDRAVERPLHVHLMIEEPEKYAEVFVRAGADRISFHPEVVDDAARVIRHIRDLGAGPGLAVHPDVALEPHEPLIPMLDVLLVMTVRPGFGGQKFLSEVVPKIARARRMVDDLGGGVEVEVDGGVNLDTVDETVAAGAGIVVAGSAVFDGADPAAAAARLRARLDELAAGRPE